ncbi:MAG: hypothetical protein JKY52_17075 [Flavobacteriales bacterium]|nr:hypothetical protein [Flavobacteriales bacterium]
MTIRKQFRQSIKCGTGAAYLILRDNAEIDFSIDIKKAALTSLANDPQSEGDRADYLARLINHSDKKTNSLTAS